MKRKLMLLCMTCLIILSVSYMQVNAETDKNQTTQKYGRTGRSAMGDINLTIDGEWVYFVNDSEQLERRHKTTGSKEILCKEYMTDINVLDGYVYGYIWSADEDKNGIYKLKLDDKSIEHISKETTMNMLVVDDWIYFKRVNIKGILRMKTDGSGLEEIYPGYVDCFTVFDNAIYLMVDNKLAHIGINGDNFYRYNEAYKYWSSFVIDGEYVYTVAENVADDGGVSLVRLSLDGKKTKVIFEDFSMYYSDIEIYGEYVYFDDAYGNLLRTSLKENKPEKLYETGLLNQYNLIGDELLFGLNTEDVSEIWSVNLLSTSERRIVPKHNNQYDDIKKIINDANTATEDINKMTVKMAMEKVYLKDKESHVIDLIMSVDKEREVVYFDMTSDEISFTFHILDHDDMLMEISLFESQYFHFFGEDIIAKYEELANSNYTGSENAFSMIRGARLRSTSTQHVIQLKYDGNSFNYLINQDLGVTKDSISLEANMDMYIYVSKKTGMVERVKLKTKDKDDDGTYKMTMDITTQYNKASISVPSLYKNLIKRKDKSMTYIDLANNALEKENYDQALKYGEQAINDYDFNKDGYLIQAKVAYVEGDFESTKNHLGQYMSLFIDKEYVPAEVYTMLAECYYAEGDYSNVVLCISKIEKKDAQLSERLNLLAGWAYIYTDQDYLAEAYFDTVLTKKPLHKEALVGKLSANTYTGNYEVVIELAKKHEESLKGNRTYWYCRGIAHSSTSDLDLGLEYTKTALEYPRESYSVINDDIINAYISEIYCAKEDYDLGEKYMIKIRNKDEIESISQWKDQLKAKIDYGRLPINKKVSGFVADNYLYKKDSKDFDNKVKKLHDQKNAKNDDVEAFIQSIKRDDDPFTWLIQGEEFDRLVGDNENEDVIYKQLDALGEYIRITSFLPDTGDKAVEYIRDMENTREKDLVIDLRGNGGGAINAAITLLDELLSNCTSVYLINRDGEIYEAKSDYYRVPFRRIFVLLDEESASSSEIVALSLKRFGENVTLVGRKTYGKGVAQNVLVDRHNKTALYLVSNYWNVLQQNIDGVGIEPDVIVEGLELEDYLEAIGSMKVEE